MASLHDGLPRPHRPRAARLITLEFIELTTVEASCMKNDADSHAGQLDFSFTRHLRRRSEPAPRGSTHRVAGLFAGVGGLERGLHRAGHETLLLCENDAAATAVLSTRFAGIPLHQDVCSLNTLPRGATLVVAGFPCQDLSQAGMTAGISGSRSGLIGEVFRLLKTHRTPWLLLENVPFMLQLSGSCDGCHHDHP